MKKFNYLLCSSIFLGAMTYGVTAMSQTITIGDGTGNVGGQATVDFNFTNAAAPNDAGSMDFQIMISDTAVVGIPGAPPACVIAQGTNALPHNVACGTTAPSIVSPFIGAVVQSGAIAPINSGQLATLTFDCLSAGTANLTIQNQTVTATGGGNIANPTLVNGTITCAAGPQPAYSSNPAPGTSINVGSQVVGTPVTTTLQVTETGAAQLDVTGGAITGANAADFTVAPTAFSIADGGAAQDVTITCTPSALGALSATLTFNTNDPAQATVTYPLTCTGVSAPPAQLTVAPTTVTFAATSLNPTTPPTQTITVTNSAPAGSANIPAITVTGPSVAGTPFSIVTDNCNGPVNLAPGNDCTIIVQFAPTAEGTFTDTIVVDAGAVGSQTVNLSGSGVIFVIPTLSEWAMMIMAALMLLFGAFTLRRNGHLN